jgi:F420-dependent oxidoreductase-like protein
VNDSKKRRITFKTKPEHTSWKEILDMWLEGERIEHYDGGFLFDHFYPIYGEKDGPCFEGWTALSYLAGRTERLRLGLMVSGNPYRNPALLANMAATFDHFSDGRLDLGIGAGWYDDEADAYGMPLLPIGKRLKQLEEACEIITGLMQNPTTTFEGEHYQVKDARCEPKPLQKPYPPIVMGGVGEKKMLRIVARFADDWNYPGGTTEDFARKIEILKAHCDDVGRNPDDITFSCHLFVTPDANETADQAAAYAEAGAEHLSLYYMDCSNPDVLGKTADAVVAALP